MKRRQRNRILCGGCIILVAIFSIVFLIQPKEVVEEEIDTVVEDVQSREIDVEVKTIALDTSEQAFTYYDVAVQDLIQSQIDLYNEENIGIDDMTLLFNPYGTNTTGLYVYFNVADITGVTYTIDTQGYESYSQSVKMDEYEEHVEFQLIGLVAGMENTITLHCYEGDQMVESVSFQVNAPALQGGYVNQVEVDCVDYEAISDGLYALLGLNFTYEGYTYLIDKYGVVRMEHAYDGDISETILFHEDTYVITTDISNMARINNLGKVIQTYDLEEYEIHHDYTINEYNEIIVLVSDPNSDAVEDQIVSVDIESGEVSLLLDLGDVFTDYKEMTNVFGVDSIWQQYVGQLDWMHINSIQLVDTDSMILSSRETNTIIKLSNIYDQAQIEYLISDEAIWEDTEYEKYSYTQVGDFVAQAGQHTVTYLEDESLEDGQYYLYMYNNNYYNYESRSSYLGSIVGAETSFNSDDRLNSMYYKYLVDENEKTFTLVEEIPVSYSSIVSSTQLYEDEIIINSGMNKQFYVYDENHELLATYSYDDEAQSIYLGYRVFKYSFEGFYFS